LPMPPMMPCCSISTASSQILHARYVFSSSLLAWLGIAALVIASLLNVFLRRRGLTTEQNDFEMRKQEL
jgi:hypothetical protein